MAKHRTETLPFTPEGFAAHMNTLAPLRQKRDPFVAAFLAFMFGGIGLGIYLRSVLDGLVLTAFLFFAVLLAGPAGALGYWMIAASYGYYRAQYANHQLKEAEAQRQTWQAYTDRHTMPPPPPPRRN